MPEIDKLIYGNLFPVERAEKQKNNKNYFNIVKKEKNFFQKNYTENIFFKSRLLHFRWVELL